MGALVLKALPLAAKGIAALGYANGIPLLVLNADAIATGMALLVIGSNSMRMMNWGLSNFFGKDNYLADTFFEPGTPEHAAAVTTYNDIAMLSNYLNIAYVGVTAVGGAVALLEGYRRQPHGKNGTLVVGAGNNPKPGAYNIDINPKVDGVYYGDATKLSNIQTGSQSRIIMENPYGFNPLNPEISRVLQPGGQVEITLSRSNPAYRQVISCVEQNIYRIVSQTNIPNTGQYFQTNGTPIKSQEFIRFILELVGG